MNTLKLVSVSQFLLYKWNYKSKVVNERFWYEIVSEAVWSGLLLHALLALWSRQRRQSLSPSMHLNHPAWWRQSTMEPHWNFKTARSTTINKGHGTFRGVSGDAAWAITLGSTTNWPASVVSLQLCSTLNPTLPAGRQQRGFYSKRLTIECLHTSPHHSYIGSWALAADCKCFTGNLCNFDTRCNIVIAKRSQQRCCKRDNLHTKLPPWLHGINAK